MLLGANQGATRRERYCVLVVFERANVLLILVDFAGNGGRIKPMNAFWIWLKGKNWSTHTIAVSLGSFAAFVTADPQAQQFLISLLKTHPAIAAQVIALAGIITAYKRSSTPASTVVQADQIMESATPPTHTEIAAVTPPAPPAQGAQ
jgi:hypothetical protein